MGLEIVVKVEGRTGRVENQDLGHYGGFCCERMTEGELVRWSMKKERESVISCRRVVRFALIHDPTHPLVGEPHHYDDNTTVINSDLWGVPVYYVKGIFLCSNISHNNNKNMNLD